MSEDEPVGQRRMPVRFATDAIGRIADRRIAADARRADRALDAIVDARRARVRDHRAFFGRERRTEVGGFAGSRASAHGMHDRQRNLRERLEWKRAGSARRRQVDPIAVGIVDGHATRSQWLQRSGRCRCRMHRWNRISSARRGKNDDRSGAADPFHSEPRVASRFSRACGIKSIE